MSIVEPNEVLYHLPSPSHQALLGALRTLKERCQNLQKRIMTLEEENGQLRASQPKTSANVDQYNDRRTVGQTELERLRETMAELAHQKIQMSERISMMTSENRQLWKRLSLIMKDLPSTVKEPDAGDVGTGVGPINTTLVTVNQQRIQSTNPSAPNLIRSRTFTKHAPNPKLRERLQRDGQSDELINLEDISLLNTCGFLETNSDELEPIVMQDEELIQANLGLNPYFDRCMEELSKMQTEIALQQQIARAVYDKLKSKKGLCHRCDNRQPDTDSKKLMKDVTVEVAESELLPVAEKRQQPPTEGFKPQPAPREVTFPHQPILASTVGQTNEENELGSKASEHEPHKDSSINLMLEKQHSNGMEWICPICGTPHGKETLFADFQRHVESHFLGESEAELSLERTYEYVSQTMGNF